jgi:hypothetical protein
MKRKSPKQRPPQAATETTPAPVRPKASPITVKRQETLPPEAAKRRSKFKQDSHEIEWSIWRSIYG